MNVLIIEDSLTTAMTLEAFVSACGHHPFCVPCAWLVGPVLDNWPVDLVLMDIILPGTDGYELAGRLRGQGFNMPIVAVTSLEDDPEERQRYGIQGYLAKPVSMHRLKEAIELYEIEAKT